MAKVVKYADQVNLSVNGYYVGEHTGTVMQDALADINEPHSTEKATVRFGTIMQDAAPNANMPTVVGGDA